MITTLEPITVKPIEIKAGLCGSCFRYRYCEHQQEGNLICSRCVAILKNQKRLIIEISELPKEEIAKQPKVKREKQSKIQLSKQLNIKRKTLLLQCSSSLLKLTKCASISLVQCTT